MEKICLRKNGVWVLTLWLILVGVSDWLFFRHAFGVSAAIYLSVLTASVLLLRPRVLKEKYGKLLTGTLAASAFALAMEPSVLTVLLSLLQLCSLLFVARVGWTSDTRRWLRRWAYFAFKEWSRPCADLKVLRRWVHKFTVNYRRYFGKVTVWLLPITLGLVFVALFIIANPLIDNFMTTVLWELDEAVTAFFRAIEPVRIFFWSIFGYGTWIFVRGRVGELKKREKKVADSFTTPLDLTKRCLWVFNIVFAFQTVLDSVFLWGGFSLPSGLTYAEYAHRGAYPLLFTALLSAAFILVSFPAGGSAEKESSAKKLVYLWIGQNVFLSFNSIWRLVLYVSAYNLSLLRVSAGIWMGLVVLGFIFIAIRICQSRANGWLLNRNAMALFAVLFLCGFLNLKGWVAWYNVSHCREISGQGLSLDQAYLLELGPAALPAIHWYLEKVPKNAYRHRVKRVQKKLRIRLSNQLGDWRGWTIQRAEWSRYLGGTQTRQANLEAR